VAGAPREPRDLPGVAQGRPQGPAGVGLPAPRGAPAPGAASWGVRAQQRQLNVGCASPARLRQGDVSRGSPEPQRQLNVGSARGMSAAAAWRSYASGMSGAAAWRSYGGTMSAAAAFRSSGRAMSIAASRRSRARAMSASAGWRSSAKPPSAPSRQNQLLIDRPSSSEDAIRARAAPGAGSAASRPRCRADRSRSCRAHRRPRSPRAASEPSRHPG